MSASDTPETRSCPSACGPKRDIRVVAWRCP